MQELSLEDRKKDAVILKHVMSHMKAKGPAQDPDLTVPSPVKGTLFLEPRALKYLLRVSLMETHLVCHH